MFDELDLIELHLSLVAPSEVENLQIVWCTLVVPVSRAPLQLWSLPRLGSWWVRQPTQPATRRCNTVGQLDWELLL